jgi:hypothetical protein
VRKEENEEEDKEKAKYVVLGRDNKPSYINDTIIMSVFVYVWWSVAISFQY